MNVRRIWHASIAAFLLISCRKENIQSPDDSIQTEEGIIQWEGAYEVDGCGYFIIIDGIKYKPANESDINDEFKSGNRMNVRVQFERQGQITYQCGDLPYAIKAEGIKIITIEKI